MKNYVKTISLCLGLTSLTFAQTTTAPIYQMSILAGIPSGNALGDNGLAANAIVTSPQGIAVDANGNVFVADNTNSRIRRIDGTTGIMTTCTNSNISNPNGMAFDSKGDLIIAENGNNGQIIRVSPDCKTSTVLMGTNVSGTFGGDGQYAYNSVLNGTGGVAVDKNDNIYIADTSNNRVREIVNANGCIYATGTLSGGAGGTNTLTNTCKVITIAGNGNTTTPQLGSTGGSCGSASSADPNPTCTPDGTNTVGDGGPALAARINGPYGIAVSPDGSKVYVAQNGDHRIRLINMQTGTISTIAGSCLSPTTASGTSNSATSGTSNNPGIAPPTTGGSLPPSGTTHPLAIPCPSGSYGSATSSSSGAQNTLYDGSVGTQATLNSPRGIFLDSGNNLLYIADQSNNRIRLLNLNTGIISTIIGGGSTTGDSSSAPNGGLLSSLSLNGPYGVWVQNGLIYWVEQGSNRVRVADPVANTARTLTAQPKSTGSEQPANQAYLGFSYQLTSTASPRVAVDNAGNVYVVEASVNKIRKVTADGIIHEWAGTGNKAGFSGDTASATGALLSSPQQVAFDSAGNGYIADTGNNRIRKVDTNGIITTVVGRSQVTSCTTAGFANGSCTIDKSNYVGDGGTPTNALLSSPQGVAVDPLGNLVIADTGHNSIRYADLTNNVIYTIAGGVPAATPSSQPLVNGPSDGRSGLGNSGQMDSTNALYGLFNTPRGVAVDKLGNIYVADWTNPVARELVPTQTGTGAYSLFSFYGSGSSSGTAPAIPTGTGSPTVPARIRMSSNNLTSVAVDTGNNIYYTLGADSRLVVIAADHSRIYQVAGGGSADTGLNYTSSNGFNLQVPAVTGVAVDANGVVYTADRTGLVRKLVCTQNCLPLQ
jgi:DNA-binding beta-propeller fold protein YncE